MKTSQKLSDEEFEEEVIRRKLKKSRETKSAKLGIRIEMLQNIFGSFQQITQWIPSHFNSCLEYSAKAEVMIEILEGEDCGQHGGYDPSNKRLHKCDFDLYDRFLTVLHKYNNENDIKSVCGFTLETLGKYFEKVEELRYKTIRGE